MRIEALSGWTSDQKHVVAASFLGWTLDAFDFFLLVFVIKDIAGEFGTQITDVTFAILLTLAMRPIGAYIFGRAADRWGRRPTLMVDVLLYSAIEFASGFAPNLMSAPDPARHLRRRHGRRMGRRRFADHGIHSAEGARPGLRPAAIRLSDRIFSCLDRLRAVVPVYRLARHVHGRRHSGATGILYPPQGSGIAELAADHRAQQYLGDRALALAARHLRYRS